MNAMRIYLLPPGDDEMLDFAACEDGTACPVPAVGEQVQIVDNRNGQLVRGPWYRVLSRQWYRVEQGGTHHVVEVALKVVQEQPTPDEAQVSSDA